MIKLNYHLEFKKFCYHTIKINNNFYNLIKIYLFSIGLIFVGLEIMQIINISLLIVYLYLIGNIIEKKVIKLKLDKILFYNVLIGLIIISLVNLIIILINNIINLPIQIRSSLQLHIILFLILLYLKIQEKETKITINLKSFYNLLSYIPIFILIYFNTKLYPIKIFEAQDLQTYHEDIIRFEVYGESFFKYGISNNLLIQNGNLKYHFFSMLSAKVMEDIAKLPDYIALTRLIPIISILSSMAIFNILIKNYSKNKNNIFINNLIFSLGNLFIIGRSNFINFESPSQTLSYPIYGLVLLLFLTRSSSYKNIFLLILFSNIIIITKASFLPFLFIIIIIKLFMNNKQLQSKYIKIYLLILAFLTFTLNYLFFLNGNQSSDINFKVRNNLNIINEIINISIKNNEIKILIFVIVLFVNFPILFLRKLRSKDILERLVKYSLLLVAILVVFFETSSTNLFWFISIFVLNYLFLQTKELYVNNENMMYKFYRIAIIISIFLYIGSKPFNLLLNNIIIDENKGIATLSRNNLMIWAKEEEEFIGKRDFDFYNYKIITNLNDPTYIISRTNSQLIYPYLRNNVTNNTNNFVQTEVCELVTSNNKVIYWEKQDLRPIPKECKKYFKLVFISNLTKVYVKK